MTVNSILGIRETFFPFLLFDHVFRFIDELLAAGVPTGGVEIMQLLFVGGGAV